MSIINRNELREQEREETKMQKWFNSFTPSQARFHKELVRKIVQDSQEKTEMIIDSCYIGAILQHTEMELSECIKIAKSANENMEETSQYLNKEREYYTMIEDVKLRDKIRAAAKKLQREGIKIAPGIKELRKTYDFPQKDIHIIWAEGREEIKEELIKKIGKNNERILNKSEETEEQADKELKEAIKKHLPKEEIPYVVTEKEIEETQKLNFEQSIAITDERGFELEDNKVPTNLKIIEQTIKGEYGTYIKSLEGVKVGERVYNDIKDVADSKRITEINFKAKEDRIKKEIEELNKEIYNLNIDKKQELEKYAEIEQVFNINT